VFPIGTGDIPEGVSEDASGLSEPVGVGAKGVGARRAGIERGGFRGWVSAVCGGTNRWVEVDEEDPEAGGSVASGTGVGVGVDSYLRRTFFTLFGWR